MTTRITSESSPRLPAPSGYTPYLEKLGAAREARERRERRRDLWLRRAAFTSIAILATVTVWCIIRQAMTFRPPYRFRICTEIAGHVFELVRFQRCVCHSDMQFWFEGREERTWLERPLLDSETDTQRPHIGRKKPRIGAPLAVAEKARLEETGIAPEFKSHE